MTESGYEIRERIFAIDECDRIIDGLIAPPVSSGRAGIRNLMRDQRIVEIANDSRLVDAGTEGRRCVPYKATLFEKTGKANWLVAWHQDTALPVERGAQCEGWGAPSVKDGVLFMQAPTAALETITAIRIHLDPSDSDNGPLRVLPGSHRNGVLRTVEIQKFVDEIEPVECVVGKGGVVIMSPLVLHASSKIISNKPRRVLHIEYAPSLSFDDGMKLAIA